MDAFEARVPKGDSAALVDRITARPFHGTARLDPRSKGLLLILLGLVSYFVNGEVLGLILVSGVALFIACGGGGRTALKMVVGFVVVDLLCALLRYVQIPLLSVMMSVFGVTVLKIIPIAALGWWILRTTPMDDLTVALERMHLPKAVTIPLVVMFRYIPTLGIEYRQIRQAMAIRGISDTFWKRLAHPAQAVEFILIPLLMRCLKVTDELAASGATRGLELETRREALNEVRMDAADWFAVMAGAAFFAVLAWCDGTALGTLAIWRG